MTTLCPSLKSERIELRREGAYRDSQIPARHTQIINDTESPEPWVKTRGRITAALGGGFLTALVGNRGPGKTQLAQQVVLHNSALDRTSLYARAMTFFLDLRATYSDDGTCEREVIERYRAPRLLVIDEMQERGETPWEDRMLNHLIDLRYGDMTDTLLIANLTPAALKKSLGESIVDRLRETGGVIECTWRSFRKKERSDA